MNYADGLCGKGLPTEPSEAGPLGRGGARERAQLLPKAEAEQSGLCDDDMQEQGVTRLLTINLNDVEKELNIK